MNGIQQDDWIAHAFGGDRTARRVRNVAVRARPGIRA
jgi:hypothetical protein